MTYCGTRVRLFGIACWLGLTLPAIPQAMNSTCDAAQVDAVRQQARAAGKQQEFKIAVRELQVALDSCPERHDLLLEISEAAAHAGDFAQAIDSARKFLEFEPQSTGGRLSLGNAYLMAQRYAESEKQADQVLRADPGEPTALKLKADIQYLTRRFPDAEKTLIGLLEQRPKDEQAAYMLGRMYYQEGRIDYAVGQFLRVLKINPLAYKAYDNLGLCYQALQQPDLATRYFLTAIKLVEQGHFQYDWPYANLASLLLEQGEVAKAFGAASKAADLNPYSARNFYLGGKALWKLGKTDLSVNWLERSISLDAHYPEPVYLLATIYRNLGQADKAKVMFEKFRDIKLQARR